jgi:hypothetical protein
LPAKTSAEHVYVYAACDGTSMALPSAGMPAGAAPRALAISDDTTLVVSNVRRDIYSATSIEARLSDLDWVAAAAAAHHGVIDALAASAAAVVPFRLFTIFSSETAAVAAMRAKIAAIRRAFDRVRGREDLERSQRVTADATAAYDALRALAEAATARTVEPGGTLLLDAAFLMMPDRVDALRDALTMAAARLLRDGCAVSFTGPWPPYSFASIQADPDG